MTPHDEWLRTASREEIAKAYLSVRSRLRASEEKVRDLEKRVMPDDQEIITFEDYALSAEALPATFATWVQRWNLLKAHVTTTHCIMEPIDQEPRDRQRAQGRDPYRLPLWWMRLRILVSAETAAAYRVAIAQHGKKIDG